MTYAEIQSYVTQICEALEANAPLDKGPELLCISESLTQIGLSIQSIATELNRIADALEAKSEK